MENFRIDQRSAVITGGARGIGAATAELFARAGGRVTVLDLDVEGAPASAAAVRCDITDTAALEAALAEAAERMGGLDILVNNAGTAVRKSAEEISADDWDRVLDLNLKAMFFASRAAVRYMKKSRGGAIINLASIMGLSGGLYPNASYQASKGGVINLTRALALEWAAAGVRVNAVAPTFVRTDLTAPIFGAPEKLATAMAHTPLGVLPEVEDIARAVLFLASPAARCITGVTLPVDSGFLAR